MLCYFLEEIRKRVENKLLGSRSNITYIILQVVCDAHIHELKK